MFGFFDNIEGEIQAALFTDSHLGIAVIDRDHKIVATNSEMDRINGFDHPGDAIDAKSQMPEVVDEAGEHVDAVFYSGEPVFNAIVGGPKTGDARETYVCDYLPTPRAGNVKFVIAVVRPMGVARRSGHPFMEEIESRNPSLP